MNKHLVAAVMKADNTSKYTLKFNLEEKKVKDQKKYFSD